MSTGPGQLRVRYVDDRVRIFESPADSPDSWEKAGLLVVQIREEALLDFARAKAELAR